MDEARLDDDEASRLWRAGEFVLSGPTFERSPGLAKLLRYLLEMTVAGKAGSLKSITIAVDGLGRRSQDAPEAHARVQIARLRSALDAHYKKVGVGGGDRLLLPPGSYRIVVTTASCETAAAASKARSGEPAFHIKRLFGRKALFVAIVLTIVLAVIAAQVFRTHRADMARWRTSDFPSLAVKTDRTSDAMRESDRASLEQKIFTKLAAYEGLRLSERERNSEFIVYLSADKIGHSWVENVKLIERSSARVIWTSEFHNGDVSDDSLSHLASKLAFQLGSTTGVVHAYKRRTVGVPDTPYTCWLRFTALVETSSTIGDSSLFDCAEAWYRYSGQRPGAAMLRGWTLTDRSLVQISSARRRALLDEALEVLFQAGTLNPRSVGLRLAEMRAHAFAGNYREMKSAGKKALELNPDSPQVQALVGMHLALWDDPEGANLIKMALINNPSPPAWYHVGLAVDALMHDDQQRETMELQQLYPIRGQTPLLAVLFAAHSARKGEYAKAHEFLDQPPFRPTFGGIDVDRVIDRLPVAPKVRAKMIALLQPALDQ